MAAAMRRDLLNKNPMGDSSEERTSILFHGVLSSTLLDSSIGSAVVLREECGEEEEGRISGTIFLAED